MVEATMVLTAAQEAAIHETAKRLGVSPELIVEWVMAEIVGSSAQERLERLVLEYGRGDD